MVAAKVAPETTGLAGAMVLIDGRASVGATRYAWTLLDSPTTQAALSVDDEAIASFTPTVAGRYVVKLEVTDQHGSQDGALTVVTVIQPELGLEAPASARQFDSFIATATVPPEVAGAPLSWSVEPAGALDVKPLDTDPLTVSVMAKERGRATLEVRLKDAGDRPPRANVEIDVTAPDPGDPADAAYWQEQMREANRTALKTVQDSAKTWQGMLTGVLGLFGTVSLVAAPSVDELARLPVGQLALALVAAAFLAAVLAMLLVTRLVAAGVRIRQTQDAAAYGARVLEAAQAQTRALERSKALVFTAASLVAASGLLLAGGQMGSSDEPTDPPVALIRTNTSTLCGEIGVEQGTGALTVAGKVVGPTREVLLVDRCGVDETPVETTRSNLWPSYLLGLVVGSVLIGALIGLGTPRPPKTWRATSAAAGLGYALACILSAALFSWWHVGAAVVAAALTLGLTRIGQAK